MTRFQFSLGGMFWILLVCALVFLAASIVKLSLDTARYNSGIGDVDQVGP
ncbi:MAG TPA: hypothetical protein VHC22_12315 [Pirellulales bacterium]|nr:hypothetical protein [Pirellulales bacterium]